MAYFHKCKTHSFRDVYRDGTDHTKHCGNKEIPLAILSMIQAQSCVSKTLPDYYVGIGYT